ncbi:MAG: DUF2059 domain-containing protein, partial [Pseudomonadota bacterium]
TYMKNKIAILTLAITVPNSFIFAANTSGETAALTLIGMMKNEEIFQKAVSICKELTTQQTADTAFKVSPENFGEITPKSKLWPKVNQAYADYYNESCEYLDVETFKNIMAKSLAANLTEKDIGEAIKFFSTPSGKKFILANVEADEAFQRDATIKLNEVSNTANARFLRKMDELRNLHMQSQKVKRKPWWQFW